MNGERIRATGHTRLATQASARSAQALRGMASRLRLAMPSART